jgi:hypothetical protein
MVAIFVAIFVAIVLYISISAVVTDAGGGRLHLLDRRLPHVPDAWRHRDRPARADVPRSGPDLRLDAQSVRQVLGLLCGLLRMVARRAGDGEEGLSTV